MLWHLLIIGLISAALCGTTLQRIDKPKVFVEDLTAPIQYTFMMNQTVEIDFPSLFTAFEGRVYERSSLYNQSNFYEDFTENPELYKLSTNCGFEPAYFDLSTEEETLEVSDHKMISHVVDWKSRCTYILSDNFTVLKTCANEEAGYLFGEGQKVTELGSIRNSGSLGGMFFNESSGRLYVFSKTELFVWNNSGFAKVAGYNQTEYSSIFLVKGHQLFILHPYNSIVIYNFTDEFTIKQVSTVTKWKENNLSPVDFQFIKDQLWVLDSEFGLYTYTLKWQNPDPRNSYVVRFGKKIFFEVNDNVTFMIAFELNGDTYVAEMALVQDVLYLNRFYDKINGVKEIVFMEERVAIIGEEEMMTIQHSTNPGLLIDAWQEKSFYAMFGLVHIQAKKTDLSPTDGVLFTMIKGKTLYAATYQRQHAIVNCDFNNLIQSDSSTIYMQLNSTLCKKNDRASMSTSYCNIRFNLNYKIVGVISSLLSLILTIIIILLAVLIFVCLLISARKMRANKHLEIEDLQNELKKRMEQEKKMKEASENVLKQEV